MTRRAAAVPVASLAACLLVLVGLSAPASATFEGSPGKIAFITGPEPQTLKLWDPADAARSPDDPAAGVTILEPTTYVLPTEAAPISIGAGSAPAWSPDGTRLAYVKSIAGTGNSTTPIKHTAIFVYDLRTGAKTQLTFPIVTEVDITPSNGTFVEHSAADWSPTWSDDGRTIAFIRRFNVTPDDTAYIAQAGQNLWTVPAAGGSPTRKTAYGQEPPYPTNGAVWIPGRNEVLVSFFATTGFALSRQPLSAAGATTLSTDYISDFDVSPDGTEFAYSALGEAGLTGYSGDILGGTVTGQGAWSSSFLRFSNTGDGLLRTDCLAHAGAPACGVVDRMFEDPTADVRPDERDRFALAWRDREGVWGDGSFPGRRAWDVQPQTLPVIFIPGFLGSKIACGGREQWPSLPFPDLPTMSLSADGLGNAGCAGSAPTGELLETALGFDVYESVADIVRARFTGGRGTLFGWDWRKDPQASFPRLQAAITAALDRPGKWKDQDAGRVVLWGHSYGGLLIRDYMSEPSRGAEVARVLTAGTPYWGSPKAVFPLTFGIESPLFSPLDLFIGNEKMKQFARNLAGLYNLYPSDNHPRWLTVDGVLRDQAGVGAFVDSVGGNATLFNNARTNHATRFDGFYDAGGQTDVRVVVGTGVETINSVKITRTLGGGIDVTGGFGNGDGTVPAISGAQGPPGTTTPLGDQVHIGYRCNVGHVPLPGDPEVIDAYDEFLDTGRVPRKLPGPCNASGGSYDFSAATIGPPPASRAARAPGSRAAGPMSLNDAQNAHLIDLIEAYPAAIAVVDDDAPVTLRVTISGGEFGYTPLQGSAAGTRLVYGPLSGTLDLTPGAPGGPPTVTLNGEAVQPHSAPPEPAAPPSPSGPPAGAVPATAPGGAATSPPAAALKPGSKAKLKISGRPQLRGRLLKVKVVVPGAGDLRATIRGRRGTGTVQGSLRLRVARPQTRTLSIRLRARQRAPVRLQLIFTPARGAPQRAGATVSSRR